jgi:hypothetical protein
LSGTTFHGRGDFEIYFFADGVRTFLQGPTMPVIASPLDVSRYGAANSL